MENLRIGQVVYYPLYPFLGIPGIVIRMYGPRNVVVIWPGLKLKASHGYDYYYWSYGDPYERILLPLLGYKKPIIYYSSHKREDLLISSVIY